VFNDRLSQCSIAAMGRVRKFKNARKLSLRMAAELRGHSRPVTVGQRRYPNCPKAVIGLGSVSLRSAGEAQLFALGELGGWALPEQCGVMRSSLRIIWRPMRNAVH
jgi:hypothetical protein